MQTKKKAEIVIILAKQNSRKKNELGIGTQFRMDTYNQITGKHRYKGKIMKNKEEVT